jgi:uncharacterized FlaG/YvyC family protein
LFLNCKSRFENLDITAKSAQRIKPVLENWIKEMEKLRDGQISKLEFAPLIAKKRKKRTNFRPEEQKVLYEYFSKTQRPTQEELIKLSEQLHRPKNEIQVWFNNRRQSARPPDKRSEPPPVLRQTL